MTVIVGVLDLEFLDFDLDLDGTDGAGPLQSIALFINKAKLPIGLVISLVILNFWIIAMLIYYLPIEPGGLVNGLLLIPSFVASIFITKYEIIPLSRTFKWVNMESKHRDEVTFQLCTLLSEVKDGKMGQGRIERNGAGIVINVKSENENEFFSKNEVAIIMKKDKDKNLYYINKVKG